MISRTNQGLEDFSKIVQQNRALIFRFLLASLRDADLAETLTQECLLKAYQNRLGFRGDSTLKTWLIRIAMNLQRDHWRNRRMQFWRQTQVNAVDPEEVSAWLSSSERSPEERALVRQRVAQVWNTVNGLSTRQRTVFLLRYGEELELKEIAQRTGLKVGAVKVYLKRAVARVRAKLGADAKY